MNIPKNTKEFFQCQGLFYCMGHYKNMPFNKNNNLNQARALKYLIFILKW